MKITFNYEFDNWNNTINKCRSNFYFANQKKKKEMKYVEEELIKQNIKPINKYPIKIICYWHCKTRQSDLDNKSIKSILDQMQKSGIIKNDNLTCITQIQYVYVKDDSNSLEMVIEEI